MKKNKRNQICFFIFPFLALISPILGNLNQVSDTLQSGARQDFSGNLFFVPLLILSGLCLLIGGVVACLDILEQGKNKKIRALKCIVVSCLVFASIDLSVQGANKALYVFSWLPLGGEYFIRIAWLLIFMVFTLAILIAVTWFLNENLPIILVAIFGSIFISTVVLYFIPYKEKEAVSLSSSKGKVTLAPVIHIIFDEMIGVEGIDRTIPGGNGIYQLVRDFHERFKFRLYGKAFSRHFSTAMSIPNMLNYDYGNALYGHRSKYYDLNKWKFFDDMHLQGYEINVYQTTHINFCLAGNVHRCETLNSFNPASKYITFPMGQDLDALSTNAIVFSIFFQKLKGSYFHHAGKKLQKMFGKSILFSPRFDTHSFRLWFEAFSRDVMESGGGQIYFAHFLIPHAPFLLNRNCETKRRPWQNPYYLKENKSLEGDAFQQARTRYYQQYYEQISCVYKKLEEFMGQVDKSEHLKKATIIIHGDHGSRISSGKFFENLTKQDFVDNYSAHFSIRAPNIEPGYDLRSVSVQRLFAETFQEGGGANSSREEDMIVANSAEKGRVILAKMPEYGMPSPKQ